MKKILFIAAVAAFALTSCQQEQNIKDNPTASENAVAFELQSAVTRSADAVSPIVQQGASISLGEIAEGVELFLEETVTDLNYAAVTRGTPVYTENVGYLYAGKLGVHASSAGGVDANYALLEDDPTPDGWIYQHTYAQNIWPDETTPVQFHLRMPTDMSSHGVGAPTYSNAEMTMTYTSPVQAVNQQDIIFGGIRMDHKKYMGYYGSKGGAPVVMYHALTGVKFAIANDAATELGNIQITKISFTGLKNTGTFTFDATDNSFSWGSGATANPANNVIYQEFDPQDLVNFESDKHASNNFAESFFDAGTKQNLNTDTASKTFWLIPQIIDNSIVTRIDYKIDGKAEYFELKIRNIQQKDVEWKEGELRTYTFKINEVNLKVRDNVVLDGDEDDCFEGSQKKDVTITNTGNTNAFIRAALVGQWLDGNGDPVFGFTDEVNDLHLVDCWYEDQFIKNEETGKPNRTHGLFSGLSAYDKDNGHRDWVLCEDGYYYYTKAVAPNGKTTPLFDTYTVGEAPNSQIAGLELPNSDIYFVLEIATQAIAANTMNGVVDDWQHMWNKAVGKAPVPVE